MWKKKKTTLLCLLYYLHFCARMWPDTCTCVLR